MKFIDQERCLGEPGRNMEISKNYFNDIYNGKRVLVTGHTGFKGSWLTLWLMNLGAEVAGYSRNPPTIPNNFELSRLKDKILDIRGDIEDFTKLNNSIIQFNPEIIFHLAAQPIVLNSYKDPIQTFETNTLGTINVLESLRLSQKPISLVAVTTDKCYSNDNSSGLDGFSEEDRLGGDDPYSASKAMAELAVHAYRESFFPRGRFNEHGVAIATARAGNVIGGGDFAEFRIIPDCMNSLMSGKNITIRNPSSIRPWQHVFDSLSGYLMLGEKMTSGKISYSEPWNFGPADSQSLTTKDLAERIISLWGSGNLNYDESKEKPKESQVLRLNCSKSAGRLNWKPVYSLDECLEETVNWYKNYHSRSAEGESCMENYNLERIRDYSQKARERNIFWAVTN